MNQLNEYPMIAKTMAEMEDVLAEELTNIGANNIEIGTRMVSFTGDKGLMYKTNVYCRTALRILKPIYSFKAENADEVYEAIKQVNWEDYLSLDKSFSIDAVVYSHIFHHSKFVAYRVKDAIVDFFNEKYGKRPSVSVSNPDMVFNIHIAHNKCTLSLDSSGESLHKRGYRVDQTEAPLNEVLAAGMILKSGWKGESTFIDPMCGSGTLLIEAAMIALGIPPGIHRKHFAFENWPDFDENLFSDIYNDDSSARDFNYRIIGSDISSVAIEIARKNIESAGLKKYIDLQVKPFQQYDVAPKPEGVLMTNPPYGERIKVEDLEELYSMIGERLKHVFTGYDAYILSYKKECFDKVALKYSKRFFMNNGALECEMRKYELFSGKRKEYRSENRPRREIPYTPKNTDGKSDKKRSFDSLRKKDRGNDNENHGNVKKDRGNDNENHGNVKKEFKLRKSFDSDKDSKRVFNKKDSNKSYEKRDEKPKRLFEGRIRREK